MDGTSAPQEAPSNSTNIHGVGLEDGVFQGLSPAERQAALSLAQFAESDSNSNRSEKLSGERVEQLVGTLLVSYLTVDWDSWLTIPIMD